VVVGFPAECQSYVGLRTYWPPGNGHAFSYGVASALAPRAGKQTGQRAQWEALGRICKVQGESDHRDRWNNISIEGLLRPTRHDRKEKKGEEGGTGRKSERPRGG
jgi:hypothetical protein